MQYEKIWCKPVQVDLDFNNLLNLEILIVLLENNDCSFEGICTNQCYEVFIYREDVDTTFIYKSSTGLLDIFNNVYLNHCITN